MSLHASTSDMQPVLRVENIAKSYGSVKALAGVSLHVGPGEFVALLGPNGAGKTTLFQVLSGLFVADAGHIRILGQDIRGYSTRALARMGIVFQQPTLDPDLSVRANLLFHARLHGLGRATGQRIREELERLGLSDQASQMCRALSGGNRRKVELARALLHQPGLLLMDEATVGLDPASRRALVNDVHKLCNERGMGVLWATHLVDEAESADRVLVLHRGQLLRDATPSALLAETNTGDLNQAFLSLTNSKS